MCPTLTRLGVQMPSRKRQRAEPLVTCASVRHTVHSMARLMAAYYGAKQMFVYPHHAAKKLPPLHATYTLGMQPAVAAILQLAINCLGTSFDDLIKLLFEML